MQPETLWPFRTNSCELQGAPVNGSNHTDSGPIELVRWQWDHLATPLTFVLFLLFLILAKISLNHLPRVSSYIPESCLLLLLGFLMGFLLQHAGLSELWQRGFTLTEVTFFQLLLPPIVLEAAYGLHSRVFYRNLGKVTCFAVVGTLISAVFITGGLCVLNYLELLRPPCPLSVEELAYFASFIVAVDPVAVLAIFEELGVHLALYFVVFGESLFNDAITIVLYRIAEVFVEQKSPSGNNTKQLLLAVGLFCTSTLGGVFVGLCGGVGSCFLTRALYRMESLQPLAILATGYGAYIVADLFGWSSLMSLILCGMLHNVYAFHNISSKSVITVKRVTKMLAHLSEAAIFLFLGMEVYRTFVLKSVNFTPFIFWSLVLVILSRALTVVFICLILNCLVTSQESERIDWRSQLIIIYGGLRGAVAFALATLCNGITTSTHELFTITTLVIILFTNLVMGITIKPLVQLLQVERAEERKELCIFRKMNTCALEHVTAGVEEIIGHMGVHSLSAYMMNVDNTVVRRLLLREPITHDERIVRVYQKVSMFLHLASVNPDHSHKYLNKLYNRGLPTVIPSSVATDWVELRVAVEEEQGDEEPEDIEEDSEEDGKKSLEDAEDDDIVVVMRPKITLRDAFERVNNLRAFESLRREREGDATYTFGKALEMRRKHAQAALLWKTPHRTASRVPGMTPRKFSEPARFSGASTARMSSIRVSTAGGSISTRPLPHLHHAASSVDPETIPLTVLGNANGDGLQSSQDRFHLPLDS